MQGTCEKLLADAGLTFDQDRYALAHKLPPALNDGLQGRAATLDDCKGAAVGIGFRTLVSDTAAHRPRATESGRGYDEHRADGVAVDDNGVEPFGTHSGRQPAGPAFYLRAGIE